MEEQVGMMAHNDAYTKSVDGVDDLYQDSVANPVLNTHGPTVNGS